MELDLTAIGTGLTAIGAGLAIGLAAIGTGLAQGRIGSAGAGVIAEKPEALGILLQQGIGDTIRISLTPEPGGDRTPKSPKRSARSSCSSPSPKRW